MNLSRQPIAVLIPNLKFGGAERVVVDLANHWVGLGIHVDLLIFTRTGEYVEQLDSRVNLVPLEITRIRQLFFPLREYLVRSNPVILWVHLYPLTVMAILSTRFLSWRHKIYLTHHNMLFRPDVGRLVFQKLIAMIGLNLFYRFSAGVTCVSKGVAAELVEFAPKNAHLVEVIYNPYSVKDGPLTPALMKFSSKSNALKVLNVGELKTQKNQLLLIEAVAKAKALIPIECCIIGSGPLYTLLEKRIKALAAEDVITLIGFQKYLLAWYKSADVFVLTSNWEGFGNVIVEALSVGLNVISTDCPSGPAEILKDGELGILIPQNDVQKLVDALVLVYDRGEVNLRGILRARDFEIDKVSRQYLSLFLDDN